MDKYEKVWNHYQSLWENIQRSNSLNYQVLGIILAAAAAILTTGFANSGGQDSLDPEIRILIYASVYIITIPGFRILRGNRRHIWRLSTYVRVFLEPQLDEVNWETYVSVLGELAQKSGKAWGYSSLASNNEWLIINLLNLIAGVAIVLMGLVQISTLDSWPRFLTIGGVATWNLLLLIITGRQTRELRRGGAVEMRYLAAWETLSGQMFKD